MDICISYKIKCIYLIFNLHRLNWFWAWWPGQAALHLSVNEGSEYKTTPLVLLKKNVDI